MKNKLLKLANIPANIISKIEYKRQKYTGHNERSIEYRFVFDCITKLMPRKVLDVGTGLTALPNLIRSCGPLVTAIDNITDFWPNGISNRHYHILNDDICNSKINEKFDMITCISTLEHIHRFDTAVNNMLKLLKTGGGLVLSFPYTENIYIPNVYELPESNAYGKDIPFICQSFSHNEIRRWGHIAIQEYWRCWSGYYWTAGKQIIPPKREERDELHQLTCLLIIKI